MDFDKLLGGKYVGHKTVARVSSETTGADSGDVEAGEGTVEPIVKNKKSK